jgi:S1-C subfamily serine protease
MTKDKDRWNIPLSNEDMEDLDEDLIYHLNEKYNGVPDPVDIPVGRSKAIKLIGLVTALVFIVLAFNNLFFALNMPSLSFLERSRELIQDPEIQKLREAVVVISSANSRGTGFNIDESGVIITNNHVIESTGMVNVNFNQGSQYPGKIWATFPEIDLAVIRIEGENLPVIEMETEAALVAGDEVTIIGNPLRFSFIVVEGDVIGNTTLRGWEQPVWMIKAPIHKGSSGSPVINRDGKVVAVIFATIESQQEEIIGLAVPINYLLGEELF